MEGPGFVVRCQGWFTYQCQQSHPLTDSNPRHSPIQPHSTQPICVAAALHLTAQGKSDPPEYRKIWDEYAPRAAKLAEAHGDGSARSLALFVEASTMAASSKGLIRVATSGDLPKLEKAVDDLR